MLSLTLLKQPKSALHGLVLYERVPKNLLQALIDSQDILHESFDANNYCQRIASQHFRNEREQLKEYFKRYDPKYGGCRVTYKKAKHNFGRSFPVQSLGCTSLPKKARNTLADSRALHRFRFVQRTARYSCKFVSQQQHPLPMPGQLHGK